VIFEEADVYGDGVNMSSRLESFEVASSIFSSEKVYDDIKNQRDIQTVSPGKYLFKNVKEPVEVFAVSTIPSAWNTTVQRRFIFGSIHWNYTMMPTEEG